MCFTALSGDDGVGWSLGCTLDLVGAWHVLICRAVCGWNGLKMIVESLGNLNGEEVLKLRRGRWYQHMVRGHSLRCM